MIINYLILFRVSLFPAQPGALVGGAGEARSGARRVLAGTAGRAAGAAGGAHAAAARGAPRARGAAGGGRDQLVRKGGLSVDWCSRESAHLE